MLCKWPKFILLASDSISVLFNDTTHAWGKKHGTPKEKSTE